MNQLSGERTQARITAALLTGIFAVSALLPLPGRSGQIGHLPSLCPFYTLTGLPCPGCGLTRAFVCLGHGQWRESLHWHPLGWLIFGFFVLLWLRNSVFWLRGVALWPLSAQAAGRWGWSAAALLMVTGAARIGWLTMHGLRF